MLPKCYDEIARAYACSEGRKVSDKVLESLSNWTENENMINHDTVIDLCWQSDFSGAMIYARAHGWNPDSVTGK